MARYIDADKLTKKIDEAQTSLESNVDRVWNRNKPFYKGLAWARGLVNEQPTADVVEVCRCKDCKWYQESKLLAPNKFCFRLKHPTEDRQIGYNYADDDFCSYGERKEK